MVMQLLGKDKHESSVGIENEEHKHAQENSKFEWPKDSGKNINFPSTSSVFKVESKLEIPMFDGQVNVEVLNSWLKKIEVYFGLYQIQET